MDDYFWRIRKYCMIYVWDTIIKTLLLHNNQKTKVKTTITMNNINIHDIIGENNTEYNSDDDDIRHLHHRHSIRLKYYDYSLDGLYFVTICTYEKKCLFGCVRQGEITSSQIGKIIEEEWLKLNNRFPNVILHDYVVMPNHFHCIIQIANPVGAMALPCPMNGNIEHLASMNENLSPKNNTTSVPQMGKANVGGKAEPLPLRVRLGDIIGAFKSITTKRVNVIRYTTGKRLWQRNFFEHIIRSDQSYTKISEYIATNPNRWDDDCMNPDNC